VRFDEYVDGESDSSTRAQIARALRELSDTCLPAALEFESRGFSIVPQLPGAKMPLIKWKPYQERCATPLELVDWFYRYPEAGLAVVLGKVSNLFAVDVDGVEAHRALVDRLGEVPRAPRSNSGSGKEYRYHLFFRAPACPTKAKFTPWHKKLEFRGDRGIVVLPPSLHKSGNRYTWALGRSIQDLQLGNLPEAVLAELEAKVKSGMQLGPFVGDKQWAVAPRDVMRVTRISLNTRLFLLGQFAYQENWNCRLFGAACDLAGIEMPIQKAVPLLLNGAKPRTFADEEMAIRTIESAYSEPRLPARAWATQHGAANNDMGPGAAGPQKIIFTSTFDN
jgi:hypothetical protein